MVLTKTNANSVVSLPITADVQFDRSNITVKAIKNVTVTGTIAADNRTVTLTFSEPVKNVNDATITVIGVNYKTTPTTVDNMTYTFVVGEDLANGDKITVNGVSAIDETYGVDTISKDLNVTGAPGALTLS